MKKLTHILLFSSLLTIPSLALAEVYQAGAQEKPGYAHSSEGSGIFATERTGLQFEVRGGLSVCVNDDDAECDDGNFYLAPGGGFGAAFLVRFLSFLSAGVDFGYYMFNPEVDGEDQLDRFYTRMLNMMLQIRAYIPLKKADIYAKVSGGYTSFKLHAEEGDDEAGYRIFAPFNVKVGAGASFYIVRDESLGDMGVGLDFDYLFTRPHAIEYCENNRCHEEEFDDDDDVELIDNFQLNVHFTWVFTVF